MELSLSDKIRGIGDDYALSEALIENCFANGVFLWDNPLFLDHLHFHIFAWAMRSKTFTRAVMLAEFAGAVMPSGVDDDKKSYFQRLGAGVIEEGDPPMVCYWPVGVLTVWDGQMFLASAQIKSGRLTATMFDLTVRHGKAKYP